MLRHPLAANLVMVVVLALGVLTVGAMSVQFLPSFNLKLISISAPWPGANPEQVQKSVLDPLENKVKGLDGLDFFESTASYNYGSILVELKNTADISKSYDELVNRINAVSNMPQDLEKIKITQITNLEPVARLVVSAEDSRPIRYFANRIRDELYGAGLDQIFLAGNASQEIRIEVPMRHLHHFSQGIDSLSYLIRQSLKGRPVGDMGDGEESVMLTLGNDYITPDQIRMVPIKLAKFSHPILIDDIATVRYASKKEEVKVFQDGKVAVELNLKRSQDGNTLESANNLMGWLKSAGAMLPDTISLSLLEEKWRLIQERILLLVENGLTGLLLIFALLFLFFNLRVAFWIALGIPVSFSAALFILNSQGGTINMISLFALIMTLGIIVDDTIVVGEQAVTEFENGQDPQKAAFTGAMKMVTPVFAASLTTVAAFLPLLVLSSVMGQVLRDIPIVAISVIIASLLECFLILPHHLSTAFVAFKDKQKYQWRKNLQQKLHDFQFDRFHGWIGWVVAHPAAVICVTLATTIMAFSLIRFGLVGFDFFPRPPSTNLYLDVRFYAGTSEAERVGYLNYADNQLHKAMADLGATQSLKSVVSYINRASPYTRGGLVNPSSGSKFGSMIVELDGPDSRTVTNIEIKKAWAKLLEPSDIVETSVIQEPKGGPPGQDISIILVNQTPEILKQASIELQELMAKIPGVDNITDNLPEGKRIINLELSPQGRRFGLTLNDISSQLRVAVNGIEVDNYFADGVENEIMVVLDESDKTYLDQLNNFPILLADGSQRLLGDLVIFNTGHGFESLRRFNGMQMVNISADVDKTRFTTGSIISKIQRDILPGILQKYHVELSLAKQDRYQKDTLPEMKFGAIVGLMLIYVVIAWIIRSFIWPFVIMITIPLGVVGAVIGHFLMGMNLTLLSIFGLFGLAGIVVNGSIILLMKYQELRRNGLEVNEASIMASCMRFRALTLTTLTTAGGLAPLLFEKSMQAQYLIPMATSIVFGLIISTTLMLGLIPALIPLIEKWRQD